MNSRTIFIDQPYLLLPIVKETPEKVLCLFCEGEEWTEFSIPAGLEGEAQPKIDFEAALPVEALRGQTLELRGELPEWFFAGVRLASERPAPAKGRPLLHLAPEMGWGNDPNGLIFRDGVYHFYYQNNPVNTRWNNMSWAHAHSRDLLHWETDGIVMLPQPRGTVFSGCGLMNDRELLGLPKDAMLFFYTIAGVSCPPWDQDMPFTQNYAYSLDGGKTLVRPEDDVIFPRLSAETRDPKIYWYEPGGFYYMVLYINEFSFGIFQSTDLKHWAQTQLLKLDGTGMWECPDLFPLHRADGSEVWVFWSADGYYLLGDFDGFRFTTDGVRRSVYPGPLPYAAQTWSGTEGSPVTIPWLRTANEGKNFRGCYGLPRTIGLEEGDRVSLRLVPQFYEQRRKRAEASTACLHWQQAEETVFQVETRAEKPCSVVWTFPGGHLVYDEAAGTLTANGEKHLLRSGLTDFSLVLDRGIAEFSAGCDTFLLYLELPDGALTGSCEVKSEEALAHQIYTVE